MKLQLLSTAATWFILSSSPLGSNAQIVDETTTAATTTVSSSSTTTPAASDASSTTIVSPTFQSTTTTAAAAEAVVAPAPATPTSSYTPEQCDSWVTDALAADTSNSGGLTKDEYLTFLQSITNPPYIGEYFQSVNSFAELSYAAKIVNKIITCACSSLPGYNSTTCCIGTDKEIPLVGFNSTNPTPAELTYQAYFCETIGNLVRKVPTEQPTSSPSVNPTLQPSSTTGAPVSEAPISVAPTTVIVTVAPSSTSSPTTSDNVVVPSTSPSKKLPLKVPDPIVEQPKGGGLTKGGIAGIVIAILCAILFAILLIAYMRHKEQQRLRRFAGGEDGNAHDDLVPGGEDEEGQEEEEEEDDVSSSDSSSEPSVWSESDEKDDTMVDDEEEQKMTEGSAVAAMGVASTVVTQISSSKNGMSGSNSS